MAYVYSHTTLDTNTIFYIGIGTTSNYKRAYIKSNRKSFWKRIIEKHNYKVEIIEDNLLLEEALEKEKFYIALYGRRDLGLGTLVNHTDGGEGNSGGKRSKEFCEALSKRKLGTKTSEESKLKMRLSALGRKNTLEQIEKTVMSKRKIVFDTNTGIYYDSTKEASDLLGIKRSTLIHCLTKRNKTHSNLIYA